MRYPGVKCSFPNLQHFEFISLTPGQLTHGQLTRGQLNPRQLTPDNYPLNLDNISSMHNLYATHKQETCCTCSITLLLIYKHQNYERKFTKRIILKQHNASIITYKHQNQQRKTQ